MTRTSRRWRLFEMTPRLVSGPSPLWWQPRATVASNASDTGMTPPSSMLRNTFLARKKREGCGKEERRGYHRTPARNELQDDRRSNNYFFFFAAGFFAA